MDLKKYKKESERTFAYRENHLDKNDVDLLHCAIGASTESNELLDQFKKHIFYGKKLDVVNIGEEIADTIWYLSNLARLLDLDIEKLLDNNINKLKIRYPLRFEPDNAINRDLDSERKELEK